MKQKLVRILKITFYFCTICNILFLVTCSDNGGNGDECEDGLVLCDDECVDLNTDPDNCGKCGNVCGWDEVCRNGRCVSNCIPNCSGKECGDDGCGGSCGSCSQDKVCQNGRCVSNCIPNCSGKECGDDGCGGSCGSCAQGEVCQNGRCVPTIECYDHYDCGNNEICYYNNCEVAWGREYRITVVSAQISEKNVEDDNKDWDIGGGMPDPFVIVAINDNEVGRSEAIQDTLSPVWNYTVNVTLYEGDEISFWIFDEDISEHDYIGGVRDSDPISTIKEGGFTFTDPSYTVQRLTVEIEPR